MTFSRSRRMTAGTLVAIAATLLFQASIVGAAEEGPLRINFDKCIADDGEHYEGTVDGDLGVGTVNFTFASLAAGATTADDDVILWQFSGVYTITIPPSTEPVVSAFAAGIDNLRSGSGHDVLNGVVIAGPYLGARVQVRAEDYDDGRCSRGAITITPIR
jgi:hypothetical protein